MLKSKPQQFGILSHNAIRQYCLLFYKVKYKWKKRWAAEVGEAFEDVGLGFFFSELIFLDWGVTLF